MFLTVVKNSIFFNNDSGYNSTHRKGEFSFIDNFGNGYNSDIPEDWSFSISADPLIGSGRLTIPADSPCKEAGENGTDIGANIYYRYEDGVLSDIPLWPFPMQQRIFDELGIDVMAELAAMFNLQPFIADADHDSDVDGLDLAMAAAILSGNGGLVIDFGELASKYGSFVSQ